MFVKYNHASNLNHPKHRTERNSPTMHQRTLVYIYICSFWGMPSNIAPVTYNHSTIFTENLLYGKKVEKSRLVQKYGEGKYQNLLHILLP